MDHLTQIIHYKFVKTIINTTNLVKIIINLIVKYYNLAIFIKSNKHVLFILKFLLSL